MKSVIDTRGGKVDQVDKSPGGPLATSAFTVEDFDLGKQVELGPGQSYFARNR